jgi:hypothetical protein
MHAVAWGDRDILRAKLQASLGELSAEQLARALQQALTSTLRNDTESTRACVTILIEAGAPLEHLSFNAFCDESLGKYVGVPLHELHVKLLVSVCARTRAAHTTSEQTRTARAARGFSHTWRNRCLYVRQSKLQVGDLQELRINNYDASVSAGRGNHADRSSSIKQLVSSLQSRAKERKSSEPSNKSILQQQSDSGESRACSGKPSWRRTSSGSTISPTTRSRSAHRAKRKNKWHPRMMLAEGNEGWQHVLGFFVLEETVGLCGYRMHLRARSRVGGTLVTPNFTDLMMWAVLLGHLDLSRVLWLRSPEPLRAAVMASRLCLKLKETNGASSATELQQASDTYEDWAVGLLDQIAHSEDAVDLLTYMPTRHEDGERPESVSGRVTKLWHGSVLARMSNHPTGLSPASFLDRDRQPNPTLWQVLDEARSTLHPRRRFISHRHCQHVLDLYVSCSGREPVAPSLRALLNPQHGAQPG